MQGFFIQPHLPASWWGFDYNYMRFKKGHIPWHKGKKTGIIPKHSFKKGHIPWSKGLTKDNDKRLQRLSVSLLGNKNHLGRKHSEETKRKIGLSSKGRHIGRKLTEEHKKKIGIAGKGRVVSKEVRMQISKSSKGKKLSEETKRKLREANIGKKQSEATIAKRKKTINERKHTYKHWKGGIATSKKRKVFSQMRRQRRIEGANGTHTLQQWEELKKKYNYMCLCCKRYEPEIKLTEDHIIPISRGGSDYIENIQLLCRSCNSKKHTKDTNYLYQLTK